MDYGLRRHEDNLPQVIQTNEIHALCDEARSVPLRKPLLVEVDHAKEAIKTSLDREGDGVGKEGSDGERKEREGEAKAEQQRIKLKHTGL